MLRCLSESTDVTWGYMRIKIYLGPLSGCWRSGSLGIGSQKYGWGYWFMQYRPTIATRTTSALGIWIRILRVPFFAPSSTDLTQEGVWSFAVRECRVPETQAMSLFFSWLTVLATISAQIARESIAVASDKAASGSDDSSEIAKSMYFVQG